MKTGHRKQYSLAEKQKLIAEIDALVAGGMEVKNAAPKAGTSAGNYWQWKRKGWGPTAQLALPVAAPRPGVGIPLADKQQILDQVVKLKAAGLSAKEALVKIGCKPDDYYRYRHQVAKANGTLPAVVTPKAPKAQKQVEMLNFDMGPSKSPPFVLMIGNAEDMKSTLAQLGQILKG